MYFLFVFLLDVEVVSVFRGSRGTLGRGRKGRGEGVDIEQALRKCVVVFVLFFNCFLVCSHICLTFLSFRVCHRDF